MTSKQRVLALSALACASVALSEEAVTTLAVATAPALEPKNVALMSLGDLVTGGVGVEYERAVVPWLGLTFGLGMRGFRTPLVNPDAWSTAARAEVGVRLHFLGGAPAGPFLDAHLAGVALMTGREGAPPQPLSWGAGASAGYQFVVLPSFALQLGAGAGFIDSRAGLVWEPRLRFGLGVAL